MTCRNYLTLSYLLLGSIFTAYCGPFGSGGGLGKEIENWETSNRVFRIRITEYRESEPVYLTHFFYNFKSSPAGSDEWTDIVTVVSDDDVAIPREQVRFISERVGYFYMVSTYAVTSDGGRTWSVFDVRKDPPLGEKDNYLTIRDVRIAPDGTGTMTLLPETHQQRQTPLLHTKDYGHHWDTEQ